LTSSSPGSQPLAPRPFAVLATVLPATFMQLVDISIVNVAIPSLQRDIGATYAQIQLVLAGYQLAFACVLITAARLGDIHGRKRLFLIGMAGFTATSALCGAAPTANILVAGRILQGLMSGIMFPQVISVIQVAFAPDERGKAFGIYGATIGVATIAGPLLGGVLIALDPAGLDWRSVFYVNVPIGLAAMAAALRHLPESRAPEGRRLDLAGAALATVGLFLLVFPLTEGRESGWPPWIFAMLSGAAVALGLFAVLQHRKTRRGDSPLVYTTLFRDRAFRRGIVLAAIFSSTLPAFFLALTLYLQIGFAFSPLHAGLTTLPFSIGSALVSLNSNRMVKRYGLRALQLGCLLMVIALAGMSVAVGVLGTAMTSWHLVGLLLLAGGGLGLVMAPMTTTILSGIQGREVGSASGVLSTGQQVGGALGVTAIGVVFFSLLPHQADLAVARVMPELEHRLAAAGVAAPAVAAEQFAACFAARSRSPDPSARPPACRPLADRAGSDPVAGYAMPRATRESFAGAFHGSLLYPIAGLALCFLLTFWLPRPTRTGDEAAGRPRSPPREPTRQRRRPPRPRRSGRPMPGRPGGRTR